MGLGNVYMQRVDSYLENTRLSTEGPLQAWVEGVLLCVRESALETACGAGIGAHTHTCHRPSPAAIWFVDNFIGTSSSQSFSWGHCFPAQGRVE